MCNLLHVWGQEGVSRQVWLMHEKSFFTSSKNIVFMLGLSADTVSVSPGSCKGWIYLCPFVVLRGWECFQGSRCYKKYMRWWTQLEDLLTHSEIMTFELKKKKKPPVLTSMNTETTSHSTVFFGVLSGFRWKQAHGCMTAFWHKCH